MLQIYDKVEYCKCNVPDLKQNIVAKLTDLEQSVKTRKASHTHIQSGQKKWEPIFLALTLLNLNQFSKFACTHT